MLHRQITAWRPQYGPGREVIVPQIHEPGEASQPDFTQMSSLNVTLGSVPFRTCPRRDAWRKAWTPKSASKCALCSGPLTSSHARYCSPARRQQAFRLRHIQLAGIDERKLGAELRRRGALVAHTLYECSVCGERSVGDRCCQKSHVLKRAVGFGGQCHECEQPILLAELLELEVLP
jgi:hypothetical protein